ncbi:hypothetical protein K1F50_20765 [Muricauda oceani]|uniref:Uncharacterized protein n=1 Tax=Flagellimonas oceani TaxID=2698672 RepID=A0A6G7J6W8_9FLAO|nr:hypothetical protein [Allomuricauda oceani]MBW8245247.1 hypothetical protein [Allomuricauda oceani]QII46192.1 hypothetical protein GVT53_16400 [Allomuricauda oceani]
MRIKIILFAAGIVLTLAFCVVKSPSLKSMGEIKPSYTNGGGYRLKKFKTNGENRSGFSVIINLLKTDGSLFDYQATLMYGCNEYVIDSDKKTLSLENSDIPTQFKIISVGYFVIETEPISLSSNDSIAIDFIMAEDDRPFINCE